MKEFGEYHMCLRKRGKDGFSVTPCVLRKLSMADRDEAMALHRAVGGGANHELFAPGSDEDFLRLLSGAGAVLGVLDGKRVVCMRTVLFRTDDDEILRESMGLLPDQKERMAFVEYCIVRHDYRGNNLQFLTYYYMEAFLWDDFDYMYTTVSPRNLVSLRNVIGCGFRAFQLKERYGGHMRYLLRKDFKHGSSIRTNRHQSAPLRDYRAQQKLMSEGKVGYRLIRGMSGIWMAFGAPVK